MLQFFFSIKLVAILWYGKFSILGALLVSSLLVIVNFVYWGIREKVRHFFVVVVVKVFLTYSFCYCFTLWHWCWIRIKVIFTKNRSCLTLPVMYDKLLIYSYFFKYFWGFWNLVNGILKLGNLCLWIFEVCD